MKIAIGADPLGEELVSALKTHLQYNRDVELEDFGIGKYYDIAAQVAIVVGSQKADLGILACITGMGMSIVANKHPKIYAALVESEASAKNSRSINNTNVLCLGGKVTSKEDAIKIVDTWLAAEFSGPCDLNHEQGWEEEILEVLDKSMDEIAVICESLSNM